MDPKCISMTSIPFEKKWMGVKANNEKKKRPYDFWVKAY
jgi:hypothetical protein